MTILVGYASSPQAQLAVERAAEEAKLRASPLHVVAVVQHEEGDSPTRVREEYLAGEQLERQLQALRERLESDGVTCRVEVVHGRRGDVARDLLDAANAVRAELLVIGMRRRSPVGKLVMGSVAQDVLLHAACPVLTVKADTEAQ